MKMPPLRLISVDMEKPIGDEKVQLFKLLPTQFGSVQEKDGMFFAEIGCKSGGDLGDVDFVSSQRYATADAAGAALIQLRDMLEGKT